MPRREGAGQEAGPSLAEVLRLGLSVATPRLPTHHWKILHALLACRTPTLGGHRYRCQQCERTHFVPHSCRNRHCPLCQGQAARRWLEQQEGALLPVPYFHLVFTLPHELNPLIRQNQRVLYRLLFAAASQTLLEFGRHRLGAQIGITMVLHTWSQNLLDHYHLHGIVSGGGLALKGSGWVPTTNYYLFPVRALSRMFRGKFLAGLKELYQEGRLEFHGQLQPVAPAAGFERLVRAAAKPDWVVYAKRPFAGPQQVLRYLSHYTHRVAISNRRLLAADERSVTFSYKDYADGARRKTMSLELGEFVRRFCLHVLPERFVKIRHYGLLGNRGRAQRLQRVRTLPGMAPGPEVQEVVEPQPDKGLASGSEPRLCCPFCGRPTLILLGSVPPERPPHQPPGMDSS
jgi:hypothetical protein